MRKKNTHRRKGEKGREGAGRSERLTQIEREEENICIDFCRRRAVFLKRVSANKEQQEEEERRRGQGWRRRGERPGGEMERVRKELGGELWGRPRQKIRKGR